MSGAYRHHRAVNPAVVFLGFVAGSPEPAHRQLPKPYPRQTRQPWRPATSPPNKAEALRRFLDSMRRNDEAARAMLTPRPDLLKAWLARAA